MYNLIVAVSYEERGFYSLKRATEHFKIEKVILLLYDVKNYLEPDALRRWNQEYRKVISYLDSIGLAYKSYYSDHDKLEDTIKYLTSSEADIINLPDIIDITTLPKNYILGLAKVFDSKGTLFLYTRGEIHRVPDEKEQLININKIITVDGFEGEIDLDKEDILVLILGFEGNRALAIFSDFPSDRNIALVGQPKLTEEIDFAYAERAKQSNIYLLNNSAVVTRMADSYDHYRFCDDLEIAVAEKSEDKSYNVCIAPIGTKAQTLGLYLYWKKYPTTQILYAVPSKRIHIASGTGDTWVYTIN